MKKSYFLLIILFLPLFLFDFNSLETKAANIFYAKIENDTVYMYSSPNDNFENKLFVLPKTYFVKLINEANENYYYCSYKDLKGYVKKTDVVAMNGTPAHPYLEGLFRTFSFDGLGIYSVPQLNNEKHLATIPYLTDNLIYYGFMTGQELVPDKSDQWIYCKYNSSSEICGYVYSVFCDKVPKEVANNERFEVISNPFSNSSKPKKLSNVGMGFIIAGVAIPCIIVLFLLVKPTLIKEKLNTAKPKLRAKRNRDYFEFDDSDLN